MLLTEKDKMREIIRSLAEKYGKDYGIAVIGQAGEKLVPIAGIEHETRAHGGAHAGRSGMGTVMGSKNVKAVLIKGNKPFRVADNDASDPCR